MASPGSDAMEAKSWMIWFTSSKSLCGNKMVVVGCLGLQEQRCRVQP